jgi:hypothetical protein
MVTGFLVRLSATEMVRRPFGVIRQAADQQVRLVNFGAAGTPLTRSNSFGVKPFSPVTGPPNRLVGRANCPSTMPRARRL